MDKKAIIRRVIFWVCFVVLLGCLAQIGLTYWEYRQGEVLYESAQEEYIVATPPQESAIDLTADSTPQPIAVDFEHLQGTNPDVCGWIYLPNSAISYPIVRGKDNNEYIRTTYQYTKNRAGSIFMDYRNNNDFEDDNTVIYGHNMQNGTMFSELMKYKSAEYYQEHPYFYVLLPNGEQRRYDVAAALTTDALSDIYTREFKSTEERERWVKKIVTGSGIGTTAVIREDSKFVTLSTCAEDSKSRVRFVVIGCPHVE